MNIYELKINRLDKAMGISPFGVMFSFKAHKGENFVFSLFAYGKRVASYPLTLADAVAFYPNYEFEYGKNYTVVVENEYGDTATLDFETAEKLSNNWLTTDLNCPIFRKTFDCKDAVKKARLTITALGVYVAFLNGKRVGNEYLCPKMNDYDDHVRYQTYELNDLKEKDNILEIWIGNGWYKGRFGIDGHGGCTWGENYFLNAQITLDDEKIVTDKTWLVSSGFVTESGIYDGEVRDDTRKLQFVPATESKPNFRLLPDDTAPITCFEERKGELVITPKGEFVLDFHQNGAGIVEFTSKLKKGETVKLEFGEILQGGNFYRDNLRSAKAEYIYTSDGVEKQIEPLFTFYGFRYMKIECNGEWSKDGFTVKYLSSEMASTVEFSTDNAQLNRLVENVKWGQRSNFLDVPTDCPQRDERLGWTADTQVFSATASYNAETYNFYKKFMRDMVYDQETYYDGDFPMYSPSLKKSTGNGGAVWADAGVIVPWQLYRFYGDKTLLNTHYESGKKYVEKLIAGDKARNDGHILSAPFTFGDWLAQDGICPQSLRGGTDDAFIRSAYYFFVTEILAKMAKVLEKQESERYFRLAEEIKRAIRKEYFTSSGRLALDTQASYIIALRFGLYTDEEKLIDGFKARLKKDLYRIKCGFVGAPLMIQTLLEHGMDDEAFRILFYQGYPGWMHEINLGATTVWERWNSVDDDGKITGIFMNSLNHYAYGSVAEGIYAHIGGLSPNGDSWKNARIAPKLTPQVKSMAISYNSAYGTYSCAYTLNNKTVTIRISVPHACKAVVVLPYSNKKEFEVESGEYEFTYELTKDILHPFSEFVPVLDILSHEKSREVFRRTLPNTYAFVTGENEEFKVSCLADMVYLPMYGVTQDGYRKFQEEIKKVEY